MKDGCCVVYTCLTLDFDPPSVVVGCEEMLPLQDIEQTLKQTGK